MTGAYVLVGVDGSRCSDAAVRWAAQEAVARNLPLHLLHAYTAATTVTTAFAPVALPMDDGRLEGEGQAILEAAAVVATAIAPEASVKTQLVRGDAPASALLKHSAEAATVAVGSRGQEGFASMLLGSVAGHVATHARCPVAVVRGEWATAGLPVVVGVDGSELSMHAVQAAFHAAACRKAPLVAVHVLLTSRGWRSARDDRWHPLIGEARAALSESLAGYREEFPDVVVEERVVPGHPAEALVQAVQDPQMLVLGHGGRGAFTGMLLGSVAVSALRHAPYTVEVVRAGTAGE